MSIGSGMTKIKPEAFRNVELDSLVSNAVVPPTVFSNTFTDWQFENTILSVPAESLDAYGSKAYWKKFLHREAAGLEDISSDELIEEKCYDLLGRPVGSDYNGVTIVSRSDGSIHKRLNR